MPTPTALPARVRRHLIACLPEDRVESVLRLLQATGVHLEEGQPCVLPASLVGHAVVMAWVRAPQRLLEKWAEDPHVVAASLRQGHPG